MARTKAKLYGKKQIELHAKLKNKPAKKRTKAEKKRLKELNNLKTRRKYTDPRNIQARLRALIPLEQARQQGYGVITQDLDVDGYAGTRSALACKWLVERLDLAVYIPLERIRERVYDPQRGTTVAHVVDQPPNGVEMSSLNYVGSDDELRHIFNYRTGEFVVQLHYTFLLYNDKSGEYNWWSIRGLTANPETLVGAVNEFIAKFRTETLATVSAYGKFLIKVSCYCQMKTKSVWLYQTGQKKLATEQRKEEKRRKGKAIKEVKIKKKGSKNK